MKCRPLIAGLLLSSALLCQAVSPNQEISRQVPQARNIIEAWQQGSPTNLTRTLHIVYWTPSDRAPAPQYRERLTRCMTHIQAFYATEMNRLGFGKQSINLEIEADKLLKIHLVKAPQPYAHYKPSDGGKIRQECLPILQQAGIDANRETILIFCNMSNWDADKKRMTQNSPYYAGGTHRSGTAWQVDSPLLDPIYLDKKEPKLHDGQYGHISIGQYNSIFVGGVAHELGHALGLPHNCERADQRAAYGIALMGSGNRTYGRELRGEGKGSFLTLASGLRLASHPMFTGSTKGMQQRGMATLDNIHIEAEGKSIRISGKAVAAPGSPPVYALLAYTDPEGGGDYDATTATAIPDAQGNFSLHCTDLNRRGPGSLRIICLYTNGDATAHIGNYSPYTYPYKVSPDGSPDLTEMLTINAFSPVVKALKKGDNKAYTLALQAIAQSTTPRDAAIAKRLLRDSPALPSPDQITAATKRAALADATASSARVGYLRPMFNRLPGEIPLIQSAATIFEHGIYAHAPARHVYSLGGKWQTLSGSCGIAQNARGSVIFVIRADGKELWRSPLVKPGQLQRYQIDLAGKKELELIAEDGGDGNGSDWGLWLEPTLSR